MIQNVIFDITVDLRISVNDLETDGGLGEIDCALEGITTHGGNEGGDGLGVEAGVGKSEAAVHGVRGEFERHLTNVEL